MFPWLKLGAVAVAAAACFGAGWSANGWRLGAVISKMEAKALHMQAEARATESRWGKATLKLMEDGYAEAETLRAAVARANAAAGSLHDASSRRATEAASAPGTSEATAATVLVLSDLFRRADGRAGELAEALDAAHAAGISLTSDQAQPLRGALI
jgi:hypothetical protein